MLAKRVLSLFSFNSTMKTVIKAFLALLLLHQNIFGASNSTSSDILMPNNTAYDITFTNDSTNQIFIKKTYIEVNQVVKEIEKIANALVPRDITVASCSLSTGCPLDSVQCDAVTESPYCPDGSTLNTTRDMCQKAPDVFSCPDGFTYDADVKQCVKPLDCPSGGTYSVERNRCEYKRIYECPTGYTQSGDTCIAPPTCPSGATFNSTILKCTVDPSFACADARWTYDSSVNKCWIAPTCPTGYSYNSKYDVCLLSYTASCPAGYTLNATRNRCEKTPDCPSGTTYNATTNRCEQGANSACSGGTWNGTNCTVGSNYAATATLKKAGNNLWYDNCEGGSKNWNNAISYCASKGMRLPDPTEIKASGFNPYGGVPSCGTGLGTWTGQTPYQSEGESYTLVYESGGSYSNINDFSSVRCVSSNTTYTCPNGGTLSGTTCNNITTVAPTCPAGYTHDGNGQCYANPTCPSSGSFDGTNDVCYVSISKDCPNGSTYDVSTDKCLTSFTPTCASGYTYNSTRNRCEKTPPDCPSGTTYNATTNRCEQGSGSACTLSGGTWNGSSCTVGANYAATEVKGATYAATTSTGSNRVFRKNVANTTGVLDGAPAGEVPISVGCIDGFRYYYPGSRSGNTFSVDTSNGETSTWSYFYASSASYNASNQCQTLEVIYSGTTTYSCPQGGLPTNQTCQLPSTYSCLNGGTISGTTCNNTTTVAPSCQTGYIHDGSGKCYANPTCPSSGSFDGTNDVCYLAFTKGCATGTLLTGLDICVQEAICAKGTLNKTRDRCEQDYAPVCGTGWTFNSTTQLCEKDPFCVVGTYSKTYDKCLLAYTPTCESGYTLNTTRNRCEKTPPDCPIGTTYNAATNRCEQGSGSACTLSGGTWNGTNCSVGSSYAATKGIKSGISYVFSTSDNCGGNFTGYYATTTGTLTNGIPDVTFTPNNGCGTASMSYSGNPTLAWTKNSKNCTGWYKFTGGGSSHYSSCTNNISFDSSTCTISNSVITYGTAKVAWTNTISDACSYSCPAGGTLSGTTCNTATTAAPSCPSGYTHDGDGKCYANPTCPSSGTYDGNLDMCWLSFNKSCTMGTYDVTSNSCLNEPICDGGTLNTALDKCQISRDIVCTQGVKDLSTGKCTFSAICQSGSTLNTSGCSTEAIPLTCPSGTDTTLDVCYSDVNACKVDSSYPKASTLTYSDPLNICIVDENVVCASSLTWSEIYQKCEAVPICYNGMYNPENDFCYIKTKECPINESYPCKGPIGNQWCSPYECNPTTNQCGYAECPGGIQPSLTAEMSPSYNANLVYSPNDALCTDSYCNLANSSRFTYCGLEAACPSGFGVFEQNGQCFVRECPQNSFQENNKCYSLGCPKGTTEQGNDKCLVN